MKDINKICFILQARVNSSRLPGKMIKSFSNSSLTEISIGKVKKSKFPTENLYLSVRDDELVDIANKHKVKYYFRSEASVRSDDVNPPILPEIFEWWDKLDYEYYVLMNACNPLVNIDTINKFIDEFINSTEDGLFSVVEHKRFFYKKDGTMFQEFYGTETLKRCFNSKFIEPIYSGGPLRAGRMSDVGKNIYMGDFDNGQPPPMWIYPSNEYTDVDYQWEFEVAEALYDKKVSLGENI